MKLSLATYFKLILNVLAYYFDQDQFFAR